MFITAEPMPIFAVRTSVNEPNPITSQPVSARPNATITPDSK